MRNKRPLAAMTAGLGIGFWICIPQPLAVDTISNTALSCRPIATTDGAKPEICTSDSFREELLAYLNTGEAFHSEGKRWIDRMELWPELSENQVVFGHQRTTIRINAYLRVRDLKEFLSNVRPRISLLKASPQMNRELQKQIASDQDTRLELNTSLKRLLDAPFVGKAVYPEPVPEKPQTTTNQTQACRESIAKIIESKERAENSLKNLDEAMAELQQHDRSPASQNIVDMKAKKKKTLAALADEVSDSDCDHCNDAAQFCFKNGTMPGPLPTKDNCKKVLSFKACYQSVPAKLLLPVEWCRGTHPRQIAQILQDRGIQIKKQISALDRALIKKDEECAPHAAEPESETESPDSQ